MKELHKEMQMIFQDPYSSINPRMTVSEIIGEPMRIYKTCATSADYDKEVMKLMDTVGLAARLYNTYPHELMAGAGRESELPGPCTESEVCGL